MNLPYSETSLLWQSILSTCVLLYLGFYSWRRRSVPAALPFAVACAFSALWGAGAILELTASTVVAKFSWFKFQQIWILPSFTAIVCFVLEYANPGRWLNRRSLIALSVIPTVAFLVVLSNDPYQLLWYSPTDQYSYPLFQGRVYSFVIAYIIFLGLINLGVFSWLFIRSPQHRVPVVVMITGQLAARALYLLVTANTFLFEPMKIFSIFAVIPYTMYAIALFRFRIFDPVPFARQAALDQMSEGMLVLDPQGRVSSLNRAAEKFLGASGKRLSGIPIGDLAPDFPALEDLRNGRENAHAEIKVREGEEARQYALDLTPLKDHQGGIIGHLILFRDVTDQKKSQALMIENQRVVATLMEREHLARELHDSLGQVLGYVSMQAQAILKRYLDGDLAAVEAQLTRLAVVAQQAHAEVRDSITSLKTGIPEDWSFVPALQLYLATFCDQYGILTELELGQETGEEIFNPEMGVQLMRVIQEALTNAREHGGTRRVKVTLQKRDGQTRIAICDDGAGFDPEQTPEDGMSHFGLAFMRERMHQIGGSIEIQSQPGTGTQVLLKAPVKR